MKHEDNAVAVLFQTFWDRYGKKRERVDAEKAWQRLDEKERQAAVNGIAAYQKRCRQQGGDIPYPAAYLNQRLWYKPKGRPPKRSTKAATTATPSGGSFYGMEMW